jgi:dihydroxy-acid dehydratase
MPPKSSPPPEQPELFRSALMNLVDRCHPLARLAGLIDSKRFATAFGTMISHIAPEAAVGERRQTAEIDDRIRLQVKNRRLDLLVNEATLAPCRAAWPPAPAGARARDRFVYQQVIQAPLRADLTFLRAAP